MIDVFVIVISFVSGAADVNSNWGEKSGHFGAMLHFSAKLLAVIVICRKTTITAVQRERENTFWTRKKGNKIGVFEE